MKYFLLLIAATLTNIAFAQVPKGGIAVDENGSIYIIVHAPNKLAFNQMDMPISASKNNYLLKLDGEGELTAVKKIKATADVAGPIIIKADSLFCAQGHFYSTEADGELNKGELVFTKMPLTLEKMLTVTIPLPYFGRPLAIDYANNYWYVGYAYLSKLQSRASKPNLALSGIRHNYSDGWIKQINAQTITNVSLSNSAITCTGTYYYNLRLKGQEKLSSPGTDFFILEADKRTGQIKSGRSGISGQVLSVNPINENYISGALLYEAENRNYEHLFMGQINERLEPINWIKAEGLFNSRIIDFIQAENNSHIAFGNFSDKLLLEKEKLETRGKQDVFIARFNAKLKVEWLINVGTLLNDEAIEIVTYNEEEFIIAYLKRDLGYADVQSSFYNKAPNYGEVVIAKYSIAGQLIWQRQIEAWY